MDFALILDIIVVTILLISSIVAFLRGFVREVLTILGLGGAGITALTVAPMLSGGLENWLSEGAAEGEKFWGFVPYDIAAAVFAYAGVFVVTLIIMSLISHWIAKSVHAIGLGPIDRSLGVVFGIVRGLVLIGFLYMPFHLLMDEDDKESWFGTSYTHGYVEELADVMSTIMPESMQKDDDEGKDKDETDPLGKLTGEEDAAKAKSLPDIGTDEDAAEELGYDSNERQAIDQLIKKQDKSGQLND